MRQGFKFNHEKCVNCKACSAACILENGWNVPARNIYIYNPESEFLLPPVNLSLACNHCESAVCMDGCPAAAYTRIDLTGAIVLEEAKCIGCRYCQWNCPYEAPKFDQSKGTIVKCNLCYTGLSEGRQPACSCACPTGALQFGELSAVEQQKVYSWFPDKHLNPAIEFMNPKRTGELRIIPGIAFEDIDLNEYAGKEKKINISTEISLIAFSFLSILSVAMTCSALLKGVFPEALVFLPVLLLTGIISLFHLSRKKRSWRAITNLKKSPLSREIAAFLIYTIAAMLMTISRLPFLLITSAISGIIFLFLIDSVYIYSDKSNSVVLHSGQTLISSLIIISFFSGAIFPFIFMAFVKLASCVYNLIQKPGKTLFRIRFMRTAFLIIPAMAFILDNSNTDRFVIFIFLTGELLDRILFYIDFNPLSINKQISEQLNIYRNEKKRS